MRRLRYYPPGVSTYHVTSKCVDDQFLWRPSQHTTFLIARVLAATLEKYRLSEPVSEHSLELCRPEA